MIYTLKLDEHQYGLLKALLKDALVSLEPMRAPGSPADLQALLFEVEALADHVQTKAWGLLQNPHGVDTDKPSTPIRNPF